MKEGKVTIPNKLDPENPFIEESLLCPRCYQSVRITPEMRIIIDSLKNNDGPITVKTEDLIADLGTNPRTPASTASAIA